MARVGVLDTGDRTWRAYLGQISRIVAPRHAGSRCGGSFLGQQTDRRTDRQTDRQDGQTDGLTDGSEDVRDSRLGGGGGAEATAGRSNTPGGNQWITNSVPNGEDFTASPPS